MPKKTNLDNARDIVEFVQEIMLYKQEGLDEDKKRQLSQDMSMSEFMKLATTFLPELQAEKEFKDKIVNLKSCMTHLPDVKDLTDELIALRTELERKTRENVTMSELLLDIKRQQIEYEPLVQLFFQMRKHTERYYMERTGTAISNEKWEKAVKDVYDRIRDIKFTLTFKDGDVKKKVKVPKIRQ